MDKTYRTELHRTFLIEALPQPLTRASSHIQIFDNYIANTRLRLRSIRDPETKVWNRSFQQRFASSETDLSEQKIAEIHLNETEYSHFETFEGTEIRKNRYFHEFDGAMFAFDVYLGPLWGLNRARVEFDSKEQMAAFLPPPFTIFEITHVPFFQDEILVQKQFKDVQDEVRKLRPKFARQSGGGRRIKKPHPVECGSELLKFECDTISIEHS